MWIHEANATIRANESTHEARVRKRVVETARVLPDWTRRPGHCRRWKRELDVSIELAQLTQPDTNERAPAMCVRP